VKNRIILFADCSRMTRNSWVFHRLAFFSSQKKNAVDAAWLKGYVCYCVFC